MTEQNLGVSVGEQRTFRIAHPTIPTRFELEQTRRDLLIGPDYPCPFCGALPDWRRSRFCCVRLFRRWLRVNHGYTAPPTRLPPELETHVDGR